MTVEWLEQAVDDGRIRYVYTEGAGGLPNDGRTGADDVMAHAAEVGTPTSVEGLYEL